MRYLEQKNDEIRKWLEIIEKSPVESEMTRNRARAVRLSFDKFSVKDISKICNVTIETVYTWFNNWEERGFESLLRIPGQGRKPGLNESEIEQVFEIVDENPKQLKTALPKIEKMLGKKISIYTLKRLIGKKKSWRRIRKSLKGKRDEEQFQKVKQLLEQLEEDERYGCIDLYYFDESGFSLTPEVPYAWQDKDAPLSLPSSKSRRLNVLGFLNKNNDLFSYVFDSSITSEVAVACFQAFVETVTKTTVIVIDNAPIHRSELFTEKIKEWEKQNVFLLYLPSYSPELNKIEILWKHIKYYWLSFDTYDNFQNLKKNLNHILSKIGLEYRINFA